MPYTVGNKLTWADAESPDVHSGNGGFRYECAGCRDRLNHVPPRLNAVMAGSGAGHNGSAYIRVSNWIARFTRPMGKPKSDLSSELVQPRRCPADFLSRYRVGDDLCETLDHLPV
jgi:hypothetical protein